MNSTAEEISTRLLSKDANGKLPEKTDATQRENEDSTSIFWCIEIYKASQQYIILSLPAKNHLIFCLPLRVTMHRFCKFPPNTNRVFLHNNPEKQLL